MAAVASVTMSLQSTELWSLWQPLSLDLVGLWLGKHQDVTAEVPRGDVCTAV